MIKMVATYESFILYPALTRETWFNL